MAEYTLKDSDTSDTCDYISTDYISSSSISSRRSSSTGSSSGDESFASTFSKDSSGCENSQKRLNTFPSRYPPPNRYNCVIRTPPHRHGNQTSEYTTNRFAYHGNRASEYTTNRLHLHGNQSSESTANRLHLHGNQSLESTANRLHHHGNQPEYPTNKLHHHSNQLVSFKSHNHNSVPMSSHIDNVSATQCVKRDERSVDIRIRKPADSSASLNIKKKRFERTAKALRDSGLLPIAIQTGNLIRKNIMFQQELQRFRKEADSFLKPSIPEIKVETPSSLEGSPSNSDSS